MIENIVINRNLRPRRCLELEGDSEVGENRIRCRFANCGKEAVGKGVYKRTDKEFPLCKKHLILAFNSPLDWRVLDGLP